MATKKFLSDLVSNSLIQGEELVSETGVKMGNDSASASSAVAGTLRYREESDASYVDMCMKVGPGSTSTNYEWVEILRNEYPAP